MFEKKNEMKFTILFSPANPDHVFAANKLNTQSRNNKATILGVITTHALKPNAHENDLTLDVLR